MRSWKQMASGGQISYEDALASLTSMFPHIDRSVIEAVLEINRGAMEPTVEQLLTLDTGSQTSGAPAAPQSNSGSARRPSASGQPAPARGGTGGSAAPNTGRQPSTAPAAAAASPAAPPGITKQRQQQHPQSPPQPQWRHPLPDDFLVVPADVLRLAGSHSSGAVSSGGAARSAQSQLEADEALANMLQNELFIEQLSSDPEFAAYLRANPAVARDLGIDLRTLPAAPAPRGPGQNPHQHQHRGRAHGGPALRPPSSSSAAAEAQGGGGRQGQGLAPPAVPGGAGRTPTKYGSVTGQNQHQNTQQVKEWDLGQTVSSMTTDMRRRFDTIAARFRRSANTGSSGATSSAAGAGSSSNGGFMGGLFDSRGHYSSIPHLGDADHGDDSDGFMTGSGGYRDNSNNHGGGGGANDHFSINGSGSGSGSGSRPTSAGRADRVKSMSAKSSPYLGPGSNPSAPVEIELGALSSSINISTPPPKSLSASGGGGRPAGLSASGSKALSLSGSGGIRPLAPPPAGPAFDFNNGGTGGAASAGFSASKGTASSAGGAALASAAAITFSIEDSDDEDGGGGGDERDTAGILGKSSGKKVHV